jgi:hypothetical protein
MVLSGKGAVADASQADDEDSGNGQEEAIVSTAVSWASGRAQHGMQRLVPRRFDTSILWSGQLVGQSRLGSGTQHSTRTSPRFGLASRYLFK